VAEGNPAQLFRCDDAAESCTREREHLAESGMEQQRLVTQNEELVEREAGGRRNLGHECRQPIDAVGNFADFRLHWLSPCLRV